MTADFRGITGEWNAFTGLSYVTRKVNMRVPYGRKKAAKGGRTRPFPF